MNITPYVSEKAYQSAQKGTYVFSVPMTINKQQIISQIEAIYGVKVLDSRVVVSKGKSLRSSRGKRQMPALVRRSNSKKAYVRLAEGHKLNLFNEGEEKK